MARKTVALGWELMEIQQAVDAARILIDGIQYDQLGNDHDVKAAPGAASATLALVGLRLRDLCRAVQGTKNPAEIYAHHNASHDGHGDDTYLNEWSNTRSLSEAETAVARARAAAGQRRPRQRKAKR